MTQPEYGSCPGECASGQDDPVRKVQRSLQEKGFSVDVTVCEASISTVQDAALAVGAPEEHILKSLIFLADDEPVLVLMAGENRVDSKKLRKAAGAKKIRMADADFVYQWSGFRTGGVPPVGYGEKPRAFLDEDLFLYPVVWAAAGTDHSFFPISPTDLADITGGMACPLKK